MVISVTKDEYSALIDAANIIAYQNQSGSENDVVELIESLIEKYNKSLEKEMLRRAKKTNKSSSILYVENLYRR